MRWLVIVFVVAALALIARVVFKLRRIRASAGDDWDARQIAQLRARGSDPFKPHQVDFFFGLPSESACEGVRRALESEGFSVDARPLPESADQRFSLHASKPLRLSVPDMKELSQRFSELAQANGGRYDGWAAAIVPQSHGSAA
ncbi:MAG TPA: ribonuclease E inhibitor RraB [Steroidobacteraceae bacterium]|nr:ribonuclease E inhibitor RraB [Steroidobacteraceae bacterium]